MMAGHPREVDGGMKDLRATESRTDGTRGLTRCGGKEKESKWLSDFQLRSQVDGVTLTELQVQGGQEGR